MRVRTFFMILVLLGVLWGIAAMWTANRDVLGQPVVLWGDTTSTVAWLLVAFLATGVAGTVVLGGAREFSLGRAICLELGREGRLLSQRCVSSGHAPD